MGRRSVSNDLKWQIIGAHRCGVGMRDISRHLQVSLNCISQTINKFIENGTVNQRLGAGRPKKMNDRGKRQLIRYVKQNRRLSSNEICQNLNLNVTSSLVRKILCKYGLKCRTSIKVPMLTVNHKRARINWSVQNANTLWCNVIWTDECSFELYPQNRQLKVRRLPEEALDESCVSVKAVRGYKTVMIYGCMSRNGVGCLYFFHGRVNAEAYVQALENALVPSMQYFNIENPIVVQDNSPIHTAQTARSWMRENNIRLLDWPSRSPDMNPIENIWNIVKIKVTQHPIHSLNELKQKILDAWLSIPQITTVRLVDSMPTRIRRVTEKKGGITRY